MSDCDVTAMENLMSQEPTEADLILKYMQDEINVEGRSLICALNRIADHFSNQPEHVVRQGVSPADEKGGKQILEFATWLTGETSESWYDWMGEENRARQLAYLSVVIKDEILKMCSTAKNIPSEAGRNIEYAHKNYYSELNNYVDKCGGK